jgi:type IV pilus assembly protein PilA
MRKNKGFTLVELLAVIVILAVIALIATPSVLNMIEQSRKGAAESDMLAYVSEIEKQIIANSMDSTKSGVNYDGIYTISGKTLTKTDDATVTVDLDIKGDQPQDADGSAVEVKDGSVTSAKLKFGNYYVVYSFADKTASYCSDKTEGFKCTPSANS